MKTTYKYFKKIDYLDTIDIDDIGNFILYGYTDAGNKYLLIIKTVLGISRIFMAGPIDDVITTYCQYTFQQTDYNEIKIDKIIDKFINGKNDLTQLQVLDISHLEETVNNIPNIVGFLYEQSSN